MIPKLSIGAIFFLLGIAFSQFITPLPTLATETPLDNTPSFEQNSPGDWISEDQISVTQEKITIDVQNARWAKFTDTNSMDPVFDVGNNVLQIEPNIADLQVGDIITYNQGSEYSIIHRITEIGKDEKGWYCYVKGDNNKSRDPQKVRANQIEKVVIGIIY